MDKLLTGLLLFVLSIILGMGGFIYMEYKSCHDNCISKQEDCLIQEYNTTNYIPQNGEKIGLNKTNISKYWTIHAKSNPAVKYAIYTWNRSKPLPGSHFCYVYNNSIKTVDECHDNCDFPFAIMALLIFVAPMLGIGG